CSSDLFSFQKRRASCARGDDVGAQSGFTELLLVGVVEPDRRAGLNLRVEIDPGFDDADEKEFGEAGLGADIVAARARRAAFLKWEGLWSEEAGGITPEVREKLAAEELESAAAREARRTGKAYRAVTASVPFEGVYERPVDLSQGRFALVARAKEFTLVPWRPELERVRGQAIVLHRTRSGIGWRIGAGRGISR
ncbi:MAG: DUF3363 domain-containing protein, partial [Amphiplicatus sp.]